MDAIEFLIQKDHYCNAHFCNNCPIYDECDHDFPPRSARKVVAELEQWAKDHPAKPVKTRQSEFLKMFPNAETVDGVVHISPCTIDNSIWENCNERTRNKRCSECRRDYWLQEVE